MGNDVNYISEEILDCLDRDSVIKGIGSLKITESMGEEAVTGVVMSLTSHSMIDYEQTTSEKHILTEEGINVCHNGSHEVRVFSAVKNNPGISDLEIDTLLGKTFSTIGKNTALKNRWILRDKGGRFTPNVDTVEDTVKHHLDNINKTGICDDHHVLKELRHRKLVISKKKIDYVIRKGPLFSKTLNKKATELTSRMILTKEWKNKEFKEYNLDSDGILPDSGHLHPLMKMREEFRKIFFKMGFHEMKTNQYVESSFWNFDTLFQPQQHPARECHDTFFVKELEISDIRQKEYMERVKTIHMYGGHGSIGYCYAWSLQEALKPILRTHTTSVSSRVLYELAQKEKFKPLKCFSIDRVFRNETVDSTHLAEFHQVEGFIADYDLTLADLIGTLNSFFSNIGIRRLRFKPAYNPYTEPSMEIFGFHEGMGKWIEVGNSGMFRPEMLLPMGFDSNVRVIAWGLSLERPTMIKYGIENIRDLIGHGVNINSVYKNPICRLNKSQA